MSTEYWNYPCHADIHDWWHLAGTGDESLSEERAKIDYALIRDRSCWTLASSIRCSLSDVDCQAHSTNHSACCHSAFRGPLAYYQGSTHGVNRRLTLPTRTTTLRRLQIMSTKDYHSRHRRFWLRRITMYSPGSSTGIRSTHDGPLAESCRKRQGRCSCAAGQRTEQAESVQFTTADLLGDEGWHEACRGCTYVLHVASPFPPGKAKHEDDLIIPARDGTLRVLKAAKGAGTVKRVVVTSSIASISYGHSDRGSKPYTEEDWTILDNPARPVAAYPKSKTLAEKAAWDFIREHGDGMELACVLPGGIFGPVLGRDYASTVQLVDRLVQGKVPGLPQLWVSAVDVRDVADLHLRAMTDPKANGERFLCLSSDGLISMGDLARSLKARLGNKGGKIPTRVVPSFLLRIVAMWDEQVALIVPELGKQKHASCEKAQKVLGWNPRTAEESVVATALSLEEFANDK